MTAKTVFFGEWVALRRKALDMTQRALATQTKCALVTIKKIELGERRPSRELAEAIASSLEVATLHRITFVECARGLRTAESLPAPETRPAPQAGITGTTSEANQANAPTPLIGRAAEIAHILKTLQRDDCRLLTLVGTGGAGKTRLAAEAAHVLRNLFPDGTVVIPLASVNDATHIAAAVAHALQLSLSRPAERELRHYLRDKNMLLVLDNCEQLIEGISCLTDWLSAAPALKLLVTSRERLRLAEEWVYPVPMLAEAHAAALFEHTAHRANPTVVLSDQQDKIASICRQVECLPLAVEIAAGWTPVLSCAEIARNIQHDLDFLSSSVRNVPDRHRSMRAVFEHSWGLLSLPEQAVLMRLSVFRGGCAQAQANTVADATLPILRALLEKSLVHADRTGRFDLHALIHQFAAEKLRASGANDETEQRHFQGFLALAGTLDTESQTARGITAFAQLDLEHDNMRAALGWALRLGAR